MCTALKDGGLRCAGHAKADIATANKEFDANPSQEASDKIALAENAYYSTPEGIAKLREAGEHAKADRQQILRDIKVKEANLVKVESEAEKAANEALAAREAKRAFYRTPEGIAKLRAAGKHDAADKLHSELPMAEAEQAEYEEVRKNPDSIAGYVYITRNHDAVIHPSLQDAYARSKNTEVRAALTQHPSLSEKAALILARDEDARVANGIAHWSGATADTFNSTLYHEQSYVRQASVTNPAFQQFCAPIEPNPKAESYTEDEQLKLAANHNANPETLHKFIGTTNSVLATRIANHPNVYHETLEALARHPEARVRMFAVTNANFAHR